MLRGWALSAFEDPSQLFAGRDSETEEEDEGELRLAHHGAQATRRITTTSLARRVAPRVISPPNPDSEGSTLRRLLHV